MNFIRKGIGYASQMHGHSMQATPAWTWLATKAISMALEIGTCKASQIVKRKLFKRLQWGNTKGRDEYRSFHNLWLTSNEILNCRKNLLLVMTSRRFFLQFKISFTCLTSHLTIIHYLSSARSLTIIYYLSSALCCQLLLLPWSSGDFQDSRGACWSFHNRTLGLELLLRLLCNGESSSQGKNLILGVLELLLQSFQSSLCRAVCSLQCLYLLLCLAELRTELEGISIEKMWTDLLSSHYPPHCFFNITLTVWRTLGGGGS